MLFHSVEELHDSLYDVTRMMNVTLLSTVGVRGGLIEAIVADKISPQNYKDRLEQKSAAGQTSSATCC